MKGILPLRLAPLLKKSSALYGVVAYYWMSDALFPVFYYLVQHIIFPAYMSFRSWNLFGGET